MSDIVHTPMVLHHSFDQGLVNALRVLPNNQGQHVYYYNRYYNKPTLVGYYVRLE